MSDDKPISSAHSAPDGLHGWAVKAIWQFLNQVWLFHGWNSFVVQVSFPAYRTIKITIYHDIVDQAYAIKVINIYG